MKKSVLVFAIITMIACLVVCFTSCDEESINSNNIVSIEKTSTDGYIDTYTITFIDGTTTTFDIKNNVCSHEYVNDICSKCGDAYYTEGLIFSGNTELDGNYSVTGYKGTSKEVVIPSTFKGCPVISISDYAFLDYTGLTSVTIHSGIKTIGESAFSGCSNLVNLTIDNGVETIKANAFLDCSSLTNVVLPDSTTYLGDHAFKGCTTLANVTLSNNLTKSGINPFDNCPCWKNNKYDNAYYLGTSTNPYFLLYKKASNSIESCDINENTKIIGPLAFDGCSELKSISLHENLVQIDHAAFRNCVRLENLSLPNGLQIIGPYAFKNCTKLTSITIPNTVTTISNSFINCTSLASIIIPNSVTSIAHGAFNGCSSLQNITLPFIGITADMSSKVGLYPLGTIFGTTSYEGGIETVQYYYNTDTTVKNATYYIPDTLESVTITGGDVFYNSFFNCANLKNIYIQCQPSIIGGEAFSGCSSLTSIVLPNSVTCISGKAFNGCTNLTKVTLPNDLNKIGDYAFNDCSSLTSVVLPDSVTYLGDYAFYKCSSITNFILSDRLTHIGYAAFDYIRPNEIVTKYDNAYYFRSTTNPYFYLLKKTDTTITSCEINPQTKIIGNFSFVDCINLTNIDIPDSVIYIGNSAFSNSGLTSIVIPKTVLYVDYQLFYSCQNIYVINCESESKPDGWDDNWNKISNDNKVSVVWGYIKEDGNND